MNKPTLSLQPSEAVIVRAAATIYAAYITTGRVPQGQEKQWMEQSIKEALWNESRRTNERHRPIPPEVIARQITPGELIVCSHPHAAIPVPQPTSG